MFNQPQHSAGWLKPADRFGHLILITRFHGTERKFDSLRNAEIDEAVVDLVDLDDPEPVLAERLRISHVGIVNKIARDGMTLGRIGQAPTKAGMNAYVLDGFAEGVDDKRAEQWLARYHQAQAPAAATPPPAAAPSAPPQGITGAASPAAASAVVGAWNATPPQNAPQNAPQGAPPAATAAGVDANDPRVQALLAQLNQ
ncbi:hypothetical protein SMC26_40405 [Actinomadura fulvescens]|uniref:Uncharacterized protein n=1 Tax=Actinomadura fulvescens TaxID=46160 RepID=A0ABP6CIZ8_9ACTN